MSDTEGPASIDPKQRIGLVLAERYRLDTLLGEGAMGSVYLAEHVLMRKRVAVKVLHRDLCAVPDVVARFEREAMAAANIDHENVAGATDFGKLPDGLVFLVLEYVEGRSLRAELSLGRFESGRAVHIVRQIASALGAAHALDIVHRDLKPENVMLVERAGDADFVKILDFGIAKVPVDVSERGDEKAITKVGLVVGTPQYMAPEQALGQAVDRRADLYALGVIFYEMLAGVRPFDAASPVDVLGQQLAKPAPQIAARAPLASVPPTIEQIVHRLLARTKDERFATAQDVIAALDAALVGPVALATQQLGSPGELAAPLSVPGPDGSIASPSASAAPVEPPLASALRASAATAEVVGSSAPLAPAGGRLSTLLGVGEAPPEPPASPPFAADEPIDQIAGAPMASGLSGITSSLRRSYEAFDERRSNWPDPLPRIPTPVLLGSFFAAVVLLVVVLGVVAGGEGDAAGPSASSGAPVDSATEPVVAPATASSIGADEVARAAKKGVDALEELAEAHPADAAVRIEIAKAHRVARRYEAAVRAIADALEIDPDVAKHPEVATTLWTTVQKPASRDESFELLRGPMGNKGADVIYDLATQDGIQRALKRRAERWLGSKEFDKNSSPSLHILVSLRTARTCKQRRALLLRAKNVGGWRSLDYLKKLRETSGCGPRRQADCHPCLREDDRLEEAIGAIEKREAAVK